MSAFLAALIFQTWAVQYDPQATAATTKDHHVILSSVFPHLYAPMVPASLRGPKWGTR